MKRVSRSDLSAEELEVLEAATKAREKAYAPYTGHRVGAAVRAASGRIYAACNLEIVSLQQSVHGERNAVNMMVAGGDRTIRILVCAGQISGIPCAECRQVIWEFCGADPTVRIICAGIDGTIQVTTMGELYPFPYGPESKQVDPTRY